VFTTQQPRRRFSLLPRPRLSFATQVVLGLVLGLGVGVCVGDKAAWLQGLGKAFILLLQMTVLPYITLSLITGLGHLRAQDVTTLARKVGALLLGSWGLAFATILLMPLAFPSWEDASFFSTSLVEPPVEMQWLTLFIPSNPFHALANNLVPAVVVFSIAVGVALMGLEEKHGLLQHLALLTQAMIRVTHGVSRLTPLGVFAIVASTVGTMSLEDIGRVQIYVLLYMALALFLTFWVLPAVIMSALPVTYRAVVGQTSDVLITAFATGSALIVLPLLVERSKVLLRQSRLRTDATEAAVEVILPAFTSFPKIGTLLPMSFVLFAGWFAGSPVPVEQYPTFLGAGLLSFFGNVNVAIPLLLDLLHIPADLFQLYLALSVVTGHFTTMLTTMNNLLLTLLGACAVGGLLTIHWGRVLRHAVLTVILTTALIGGARAVFSAAVDDAYHKDAVLAGMQLLHHAGPVTVHRTPPLPAAPSDPQASHLARIRAREALLVGYLPDGLPFTYFNAAGQLVGFNIEMAHLLARDLGVALELVPIERGPQMAVQLQTGYCDIVMAAVAVTPERAHAMAFSTSYMDQTLAFIVKDHRRQEFSSRDAVRRLTAPRLGVPDVPYYINKVREYLPQATLVVLPSIRAFFETHSEDLDAFVFSAEAGSAWTLLYPAYSVAIPQPDVLAIPLAYPMAWGDLELVSFINAWIELKKKDHTIAALYDYWILGKNAVPKPPRWSVLRNVLHWVQ
jgi:Na+/H+-dicarboxylate symporter/ABC-type amino acid transport substrate-binding protein